MNFFFAYSIENQIQIKYFYDKGKEMLDFGYFTRQVSLFVRYQWKNNSRNLFDDYIVRGRCWPSDLDLNWHMNNSRYLRQCDFGRFSFLLETGLWNCVFQRQKNGMKNASFVVSAFQAQYRQSIQLGDRFEIISRMNGWDDKAFYMEQLIILEKNHKIALSLLGRLAMTPRSLTPQMLVDDIHHGSIQSPKLSKAVENLQKNYQLNFLSVKSKTNS